LLRESLGGDRLGVESKIVLDIAVVSAVVHIVAGVDVKDITVTLPSELADLEGATAERLVLYERALGLHWINVTYRSVLLNGNADETFGFVKEVIGLAEVEAEDVDACMLGETATESGVLTFGEGFFVTAMAEVAALLLLAAASNFARKLEFTSPVCPRFSGSGNCGLQGIDALHKIVPCISIDHSQFYIRND